MNTFFRAVFPWFIMGVSIIIIVLNDKKTKDNYLVYGMMYGTIFGSILGIILKYLIKIKTDIGLYITLSCLVGEVIGTLIKRKSNHEKK